MKTYQNRKPEAITSIDNLNAIYGKMPPQSSDLEKAVLGALMIQSESIVDVITILKPESFYIPCHQTIYKAILRLNAVMKPIDILTVSLELKITEELDSVGGEIYLSELTDKVGTASHLEFHAKIIQQKYIQRCLITAGAEIQRRSYDEQEDIQDLIEFAEKELTKITDVTVRKNMESSESLVSKSLERLEERAKTGKLSGVPSGFTSIDRITTGWQPTDLIILAARPSMGKSALVLNIARNIVVDYKLPVAFFSLEMSADSLGDRMMVSESGINSDKFRIGKLSEWEWSKIETASVPISSQLLMVDDTAALSVFELRSKCRTMKRTVGLSCIIVDYLQLMTTGTEGKGNREQDVSFISSSLKAIAKELKVPVIALSQLNRSVESRGGNKRPQLSDLRESGAIEQDADVVMFIHRPEYYGITEDEKGESTRHLAEIIVAKYRNGSTGIIKLRFDDTIVKFSDYDRETISEPPPVYDNSGIEPNKSFDQAPF